jgi:hypothetical protein
MKLRQSITVIFMFLLVLTGCSRTFDSAGYLTSAMNALYKGDFSAYAEFTGLTTSEVSSYKSQWLSGLTDDFIAIMGSEQPSEDTITRTKELLRKIYANASYEVSQDTETGQLTVTIYPISLITANYEAIQNYVEEFNKRNADYAFASLTEEAFYDTYMDGILNILETHMNELSYDDPVQIQVTVEKDDDGLYTISNDDWKAIHASILSLPEK